VKTLAFRAHGKQIELLCRVAPDVSDWVVGDEVRLRQVLVNLIGNAIKFTDRGEVVVSVERGIGSREVATSSPVIQFKVKDTGIGIPPEKFKAVFDPFVQVDGSMSRKHGGTGLGLSISSRLIELMGGNIMVESEVGKGSTFTFTLPLPEADASLARPSRPEQGSLRGIRVLVVDDNAMNRLILSEMTRGWGMEPSEASGGAVALAMLREAYASSAEFPLVLLDAMMPEMDGFQLAEQIQRHPELARATIMMLSSAGELADGARCKSLGISTHLAKPFKASELHDAIVTAMGTVRLKVPDPDTSHVAPGRAGRTVDPAASVSPAPSLPPMNCLVAEDNPINQILVRSLLQRQGHRVVLTGNGREVIEAYRQEPFDVVLMDISMPEMDGFEATAELRKVEEETGRRTPIVAMTAHAMKGDRERCMESGMDDYLAKPITAVELWQVLARVARQWPAAPERLIDPGKALACASGDRQILHTFIATWRSAGPQLRQELTDAVRARDAERVRRSAHTLVNALEHLGAVGLLPMLAELEAMGKAKELSRAEDIHASLVAAFARMEGELQHLGAAERTG
jgi:CheY-like chemotaxis protein